MQSRPQIISRSFTIYDPALLTAQRVRTRTTRLLDEQKDLTEIGRVRPRPAACGAPPFHQLLPPLPASSPRVSHNERRKETPFASVFFHCKTLGDYWRSRTVERPLIGRSIFATTRTNSPANARRISSLVAYTFRIGEFIRRQTASRAYRGNWLPQFPIFFRPERMNPARLYALCVALLCLLSFTVARELHQNAIHRGASPHEHGTLVGNVIGSKGRIARSARTTTHLTRYVPYHHHRDRQEETPMRKSGRCCRR